MALTIRTVAALAAFFAAGPVLAQASTAAKSPAGTPTKMGEMVLGSVVRRDGDVLVVKANLGGDASVKLGADTKIMMYVKASLSDVKAGEFIGSAAVEGPDGKMHAKEVHILANELRGLGEGHTAMNEPNTTMTNGNISEYAVVKNGRKLKVTYKGGEKDIEVGPEVPVTRLVVSDAAHLTPGTKVRMFVRETPENALVANMVTVLAAE
jgi:hypothetical protein